MTSNHHAPYGLGYTRTTMAYTTRSNTAMWSKTYKLRLSSDRSLQPDYVKLESLVIVNQPCYGEYVLGACTHRPSNHESR